jgi:hypothetical protein
MKTSLTILVAIVMSSGVFKRAVGKTFTVIYADAQGPGSLRQAILDANANPNENGNPDIIAFAMMEDAGLQTISGQLPTITDSIIIDGYTQPGTKRNTNGPGQPNNATLLIQISGSELKCTAAATIRGLIINRSGRDGIYLLNSAGHVISGNFIGTDASGKTNYNQNFGNGANGIEAVNAVAQIGGTTPELYNSISAGSSSSGSAPPPGTTALKFAGSGCAGSVVQGNTIRGNVTLAGASGIAFGGSATGSGNRANNFEAIDLTIGGGSSSESGSFSGTSATGNIIQGNTLASVVIKDGANGNLVGGPTGSGNIILRDGSTVISFEGVGTANNILQGNIIQAGEFSDCVQIGGSGHNQIGGAEPGSGNVINGGYIGLAVTSDGNTIQGNSIGTDAPIVPFPTLGRYHNATAGLSISSSDNLVGGTEPGAGNVISANAGDGMILNGSRNRVEGNYIGTDRTGTLALGNSRAGVIGSGGTGNVVGGDVQGAGNMIAFNGTGIAGGVIARGNAIYANFGPAIDAPNENGAHNAPVITATSVANGFANIQGTLNASNNTQYIIDCFGDPKSLTMNVPKFLGATTLTTDANGNGNFSATVAIQDVNVAFNATATDPNSGTSAYAVRPASLLNISTRLDVQVGENVLIVGFILQGPPTYIPSGGRQMVVRALGPSLSLNGVPASATLADPTLELPQIPIFIDNWKDGQRAELRESGLAPLNDLEAAYIGSFGPFETQPSTVTAIERGKNDGTGIGIIEAYALGQSTVKVANISSRGLIGAGDKVMIAGFILGDGSEPTRIVVRAIGPELTARGVSNALADPVLEIHDSSGAIIASNDNWQDNQKEELQATGIPPTEDSESAIIMRFGPGAYTAVVRGARGTTGVALVEVYNLP